MDHYYWRIDLLDTQTNKLSEGSIRYASEFQASMVARDMSHIPQHIKIKITKCKWDF